MVHRHNFGGNLGYNYYGVTDNLRGIARFGKEVEKLLFKWLNRRGKKKLPQLGKVLGNAEAVSFTEATDQGQYVRFLRELTM